MIIFTIAGLKRMEAACRRAFGPDMDIRDSMIHPEKPWERPLKKETTMTKEIEVGTILKDRHGNQRKVLAVLSGLYCISQASDMEAPSSWMAYHQLAKQFDMSQLNDEPVIVMFADSSWMHAIVPSLIGTDVHIAQFLNCANVEELSRDYILPAILEKIVKENWKFTIRQRTNDSEQFQVLLYPPNWRPGNHERRVPYNGYGESVHGALIECVRSLLTGKYC